MTAKNTAAPIDAGAPKRKTKTKTAKPPSTRNAAKSAKKSYVERVFGQYVPTLDKARVIAERYVIDYNPAAALSAGGYSDSTIHSHGHVMIRHPRIQAEVEKLQAEIRERVLVDQSYVIEGFVDISERCLGRKPVYKIDESGNTVAQVIFRPTEAHRALESIGRHLGMFKDVLEVREVMTVEEWLSHVEEKAAKHARAH